MKLNKITALKNGNQLFAYWANNRGRGSNNCTLLVVPSNEPRPNFSRDVKNVIAETRTSSWRGLVNLSVAVCNELGISKQDLCAWTDDSGRNVFAERSLFAHRARNAKNTAHAGNLIRIYHKILEAFVPNRTGAELGRVLDQPMMLTHEQNRRDKTADWFWCEKRTGKNRRNRTANSGWTDPIGIAWMARNEERPSWARSRRRNTAETASTAFRHQDARDYQDGLRCLNTSP